MTKSQVKKVPDHSDSKKIPRLKRTQGNKLLDKYRL